jgi:hypothetical protein
MRHLTVTLPALLSAACAEPVVGDWVAEEITGAPVADVEGTPTALTLAITKEDTRVRGTLDGVAPDGLTFTHTVDVSPVGGGEYRLELLDLDTFWSCALDADALACDKEGVAASVDFVRD